MPTVELRIAFEWTCPECGRDSFERSLMPDLGADEIDELGMLHGQSPFDPGIYVSAPDVVCCEDCGLAFCSFVFGGEK